FGNGHIPGALNVDLHGGQFPTRASWLIRPDQEVVLVLDTPHSTLRTQHLQEALSGLAAAGQRGVTGYLEGGMEEWERGGRPIETVPQISVDELHERLQVGDHRLTALDVRDTSEAHE